MKQLEKASSRIWLRGSLALSVLSVIVIVVFALHFYDNGRGKSMDVKTYNQYYVMITENRKSTFWKSVYQGAYQQGLEKDVYVELLGENLSKDYTREDLMRIAIASGVDGIIVEADESEAMTELINEAVQKEIPVVTVYGDNTQSARCSYVGVGSYNLGREYGKQVLEIAEKKEKNKVQVAVLVSTYAMDSGQNILCAGIGDTINEERAGDQEVELSLVSVDETNSFSVEESIRDIFMEEQLPDIIICLNELNTTCVYQAVVDYNKVGQISILGYYDSDTIINAIDRDVVDATISIDTLQMGSFCVEALAEVYEIGTTSQYFTTDITLINKSNVAEYLEGGDSDEK